VFFGALAVAAKHCAGLDRRSVTPDVAAAQYVARIASGDEGFRVNAQLGIMRSRRIPFGD